MPTVSNAPLSAGKAKQALNRCLDEGEVVYSRHFRQELVNDELTMQDVLAVCRSGAITMPPESDIKTGEWKYRIEGRSVDGIGCAVVFSFRSERSVFITVFRRAK